MNLSFFYLQNMARRKFTKRKRRIYKRKGRRVLRKNYVRFRKGRMGRTKKTRAQSVLGMGMVNRIGMLSPCARDYIQVLTNPFNPRLSAPPCIPDYRSVPSSKFYLRARGTFAPCGAAGAEGMAWIIFNPRRPHQDGNAPIVHSKNGARSITGAAGSAGGMTYDDTDVSQTEYFDTTLNQVDWENTNDADGHNKFRIVGAGLKVQYAGSGSTAAPNSAYGVPLTR